MTLKIQRSQNEGRLVVAPSGRMKLEDVIEAENVFNLEAKGDRLVLDLNEVTQVDRDVVGLLANWELRGIELEHCPSFVRAWILRETAKHELDDP